MKTLAKLLLFAILFFSLSEVVLAATDTKDQTVTITFDEIAELAVSGDPGLLEIEAPAVPGDLPADDSDASTTMAWTANYDGTHTRKITGKIDGLFSGIDLHATVAAPGSGGGASEGEKEFTAATTDYDFVTAIGNCNTSGNTITYRAEVTAMVSYYTNDTQTVTWTLTDDV